MSEPLTPSTPLDSSLFNSALSPHQTILNTLLNEAILAMEHLTHNSENSSLDVALTLAPLLSQARNSLGGTDLTRTLKALEQSHHALIEHDETYSASPLFGQTQDLLVEHIAPLNTQFSNPHELGKSSSDSQTDSSDVGADVSANGSTDAAAMAPSLESPSSPTPVRVDQERLTMVQLEAKLLTFKNNLQRLTSYADLSPQDMQAIDQALTALESQVNLLGSITSDDANSPLVIDNSSAQYNSIHSALIEQLTPLALSQLEALANPITPVDPSPDVDKSLDNPSTLAEPGADQPTSLDPPDGDAPNLGANEFESPIATDSKVVLEPHQIPEAVRNQFIAAPGGQYHYKDRDHALAFVDAGGKLKTANADPQVASAMVAIAKAKGWGSLKIKGSAEFKSAVWIAAQLSAIPTQGYQPTALDRALLAKAIADLQGNSIAQGDDRQPSLSNVLPSAPSPGEGPHASVATPVDRKKARAMAASKEGFAGTVLECGRAPYQFSAAKGEPLNYFVRMADPSGQENVFWGKELEQAVQMAGGSNILGQSIVLYERGKKAVVTQKPIRDEKGEVIRLEDISAMRNEWEIIPSGQAHAVMKVQAQTTEQKDKALTKNAPTNTHVNDFALMAKAFAQGQAELAKAAIEQFPQLVHIYATQKSLFEQAAQTFSDPKELAKAQESINKVLSERIAQGKITPPSIHQPSYAVTLEAVYERPKNGAGDPGDTERVMRFMDMKQQSHELTGIDVSRLTAEQLRPGAPLTLTAIPNLANPADVSWQAVPRDPAIVLHGVAAAEWARSLGANDAQAKTLANTAIGILQGYSEAGQAISPPRIQSGPAALLNPDELLARSKEKNEPQLDDRFKRNRQPARA